VTQLTWELVLGSVIIIAFFALVGEGVSRLIRRAGEKAGFKETTLGGIRDATRAIWIVLAVVGVAYYAHLFSELSVLAVSTVGGLIVSLALQATLSNVIAGLFMLEDGTLRVGEQITFSSINGTVVRVTLRTTWILTDKGSIASISNSNLMSGPLIISSGTPRLLHKYHLEHLLPVAQSLQKPSQTPPAVGNQVTAAKDGEKDDKKSLDKRSRKSSEKSPEPTES
jgi:small-conductance mechanosensitive channel